MCLLFFIHLKLELLTQCLASNDRKYVYLGKIDISRIELLDELSIYHKQLIIFSGILHGLSLYMGSAGTAKLIYLNFQPLEVVSRYREPQLQVAENYSYLNNLSTNSCKS